MIELISLDTYKKAYKIINDHADYKISNSKPYIVYQYVCHFFKKHNISNNNDAEFLQFFKSKIIKKSYIHIEWNKEDVYEHEYMDLCGAINSLILLFEYDREANSGKSPLMPELENKLAQQINYKKKCVEKPERDFSHLAINDRRFPDD